MRKMSLKAVRIDMNMSRAFVAEKLGVSVSTVKNWETGKTFPKQPMIEALCTLYNVSYDYIDFSAK